MKKTLIISLVLASSIMAADYSGVIERPNASKLIQKDLLPKAKVFTMPANCVTSDPESIARGAYIFHNLNGKKAKKNPPKGLSRKQKVPGKKYRAGDKIPAKQYGNCIACHQIEGARGGGNIGPDLTGYKDIFISSGARDNKFVFQKIADPRIDNKDTQMTVNLTTKLFNKKEICDITSYIVSPK